MNQSDIEANMELEYSSIITSVTEPHVLNKT